ncbi:arginine repressor [Liquorilactobacillus satsumensis]|uniref:Arginine repressor n=1 Tax=Liquorilactobacillus satsumensis DSM 16230 = JCM 12392 TaxID=1423801 RepID=A0A0R1V2F3_9LACO|nr:ArgR family transcriptional regulator [Liquorilactobacillus satsumensis]KRL99694.1 arginine repressor [Liquorilactobacillus satsumensis DSM 16230 = JCM 12392]MCP9328289.1 ArgR family transcriptional regulator [Liquorilactobacillus satsumensis]
MKKETRQAKIEQLITQYEVGTQEELMKLLTQNGIAATQATISRDMREMRIVKEQSSSGKIHYAIFKGNAVSEKEKLYNSISEAVLEVVPVQFINIVKTLPHNANVLTAIIDELALDEIVGTIAGYDTILVISKSEEDARKVNSLFTKYAQHDESAQ